MIIMMMTHFREKRPPTTAHIQAGAFVAQIGKISFASRPNLSCFTYALPKFTFWGVKRTLWQYLVPGDSNPDSHNVNLWNGQGLRHAGACGARSPITAAIVPFFTGSMRSAS